MKNFKEKEVLKSLFLISVPILISNLLQSAYQLTDAFWVWRLWENALAAVSLSFPITFFMISLWSGFAMAWSTLIAQYFWAKNKKMVNHIWEQTMFFVALLSILIWIVWYFMSWILLNLLWVDKNIYNDALSFLQISFIWMIFVFFFAMFQSILRWIGEVKLPMKIVFLTVIINFVIDPLFIFWIWPIDWLGITWAAIATLITQFIASLIWVVILVKWKYWIKINFHSYKPDLKFIKRIFSLWLPSSLEMSARSLWLVAMTFLITSFWSLSLASYWAWSNILQFVMIVAMWISMATSVLVWQNLGAKNVKMAENISKVSILSSFLFLNILWVIVYFLWTYFVKIFVPNSIEIISLAWEYLKIISFWFGAIWIQMVVMGILRAWWKMKTALVLTLFSQWIIQIPLAFIFSKYLSYWLNWIWYSMLITNIIMMFTSLYFFYFSNWRKNNLTNDDVLIEKVYEDVVIEDWYKN